jgi:hypothetical protein
MVGTTNVKFAEAGDSLRPQIGSIATAVALTVCDPPASPARSILQILSVPDNATATSVRAAASSLNPQCVAAASTGSDTTNGAACATATKQAATTIAAIRERVLMLMTLALALALALGLRICLLRVWLLALLETIQRLLRLLAFRIP